MADRKIEDATRVSSVDGTEILPASVGSAAKSLTTEQVKNYVLDALTLVTGVETVEDTDPIFVVNSDSVKKIPLDDLVDKVAGMLFDKTAVEEMDDDTVISVEDGGTAKTATMAQVLDYIEDNVASLAMDIHSLTAADAANTTDEMVAYQTSAAANRKVTVAQLATAICGQTADKATTRSTAIGSTDYLLIGEPSATTGEPPVLKKVLFGSSGISTANKVIGPSANTANKIPQWNGANSKTLKDGLALVETSTSGGVTSSNINVSCGNDEVASAAAVYQYGQEISADKAIAPASTTANKIPQWDSTSKTLKDGLTLQTSIRATASASDSALVSEKAVSTEIATINSAISNAATAPSTTTEDKIPQWDSTSKTLKDGLTLVGGITSSATDSQVPTAKAVNDALEEVYSYYTHVTYDNTAYTGFSELPTSLNAGDFFICIVDTKACMFVRVKKESSSTNGWRYVGQISNSWPTFD